MKAGKWTKYHWASTSEIVNIAQYVSKQWVKAIRIVQKSVWGKADFTIIWIWQTDWNQLHAGKSTFWELSILKEK